MQRNLGIFIFHNDLRITDNVGLAQLSKICDVVLPIFIFTPEQIGSTNKYRSLPAIEFMLAQLEVLDLALRKHHGKLYTFYGSTAKVVTKLIQAMKPTAVCNNANYTPFALDRDSLVKSVCERHNCDYILCEDYGLYQIGTITRTPADPIKGVYKKFTPFYNAARTPDRPLRYQLANLYSGNISGTVPIATVRNRLKVGSVKIESAASMLASLKHFGHYNRDRDKLAIPTTRLSAHIKFGAVSVRDVYWAVHDSLGKNDLIKQLYWREFYMNILWAYPYVLQGRNFNPNFRANWRTTFDKSSDIANWCSGKTGYPVVDACMRELNATGYMHNRGRLITAAFLTKILGWHWKFGELYFATKLRDYDPAQNNGNWQFVAGSGVDQQPYFRMFNPWIQSKAHDPECKYIKHWCPEYKDVPNAVIHNEAKLREFITQNGINVAMPMVNYEKQRDLTKKRYRR
jgi:deoxyribodipyrimidine photo-lyase